MADSRQESSVWLRTRASLLERLKRDARDDDWKEFYDLYWRVVYGYAMRLGLNPTDAQDIVQEVFIAVLRRLPALQYDRSRGRFLSWMKKVTRHKVIDAYRRRQARVEGGVQVEPRDGEGDALDRVDAPVPGESADPWETEWQNAMLSLALERVRTRVDAATYQAFCLYALQGQSPQQVLEATGLPSANAVYLVRTRMVQYLKEEVERIAEEI